ncbi:MAG: flagellar biosynthesis anti-sigma factor FlgM [Proteobacteria bacterium]|nr:flagellar biosynthesis anti-sigma factor FlgM [Pseudomonadota bacterium]MBU1709403.1 flagellar biosynthesis anti-sigma factor FlgM [Pseudomonadota bacterium]
MKLTNLFPQIKTDNKIQIKKTADAGVDPARTAGSTVETDRVELSDGSRDVQKMQEILLETPVVREEKVQELKQQVASGKYQVDPYKVADRMLTSLLTDYLPED